MNTEKKYIFILASLIVLLFLIEFFSAPEIDWSLSYSREHKKPFGSYVVYELLPNIFPQKQIEMIDIPFYNAYKRIDEQKSNYFIINNEVNFDKLDSEKLLEYIYNGNTVFIAAQEISGEFADSLNIVTAPLLRISDSLFTNFVNPHLKSDEMYIFKTAGLQFYFTSFDTSRTQILGRDQYGNVNFIKMDLGQGTLLLNTNPTIFTNYNILSDINYRYIETAFSYIALNKTFWDEYYKIGRSLSQTPLRYILNREALKWAYYLALFSIILFLIFEGKRKQRLIPIIEPLRNTSDEFVDTIGNLSYYYGDHKRLVQNKVKYFLENLRIKYYLDTNELSGEFSELVARKSGVKPETVKKLFDFIQLLNLKENITEEEVLLLNQYMESFQKEAWG